MATAALGRALAAASMMGNALKEGRESVTLQIKGGGPLGTVLAVSRQCRQRPGERWMSRRWICPCGPDGKLDVGTAVGHEGTLTVIRDLNMKEPYVGSVGPAGRGDRRGPGGYFAESEQIPTACGLGVLVDRDQSVLAAGGYLIQLLPGAGGGRHRQGGGEHPGCGAGDGSPAGGPGPETMLRKALSDFDLEILEKSPIGYRCTCSRERMERGPHQPGGGGAADHDR